MITTFTPPFGLSSRQFVRRCRVWGYEVAGMSGYLQQQRWVQIVTMGPITPDDLAPFFEQMARWSERRQDIVAASAG